MKGLLRLARRFWPITLFLVFVFFMAAITSMCSYAGSGSVTPIVVPEEYIATKPIEGNEECKICEGLKPEYKNIDFSRYDTLSIPRDVVWINDNAFSSDNVPESFSKNIDTVTWMIYSKSSIHAVTKTGIGKQAFANLENLSSFYFPNFGLNGLKPVISDNVFENDKNFMFFYNEQEGDPVLFNDTFLTGTLFNKNEEDNAGMFVFFDNNLLEKYKNTDGWKEYPADAFYFDEDRGKL